MLRLSRSNVRRFGMATLLATTSLGSGLAFAETADDGKIQEIVVTAQKRQEKLSETPLAVTALSAQSLESMGATEFRDFADTVPGLSYTSSGAGQTQIN